MCAQEMVGAAAAWLSCLRGGPAAAEGPQQPDSRSRPQAAARLRCTPRRRWAPRRLLERRPRCCCWCRLAGSCASCRRPRVCRAALHTQEEPALVMLALRGSKGCVGWVEGGVRLLAPASPGCRCHRQPFRLCTGMQAGTPAGREAGRQAAAGLLQSGNRWAHRLAPAAGEGSARASQGPCGPRAKRLQQGQGQGQSARTHGSTCMCAPQPTRSFTAGEGSCPLSNTQHGQHPRRNAMMAVHSDWSRSRWSTTAAICAWLLAGPASRPAASSAATDSSTS